MQRLLVVIIPLFILSCNLLTESNISQISVRAQFKSNSRSVTTVDEIWLEVTAPDMKTITKTVNTPFITMSVPKGNSRTFKLEVIINGAKYTGESTTDLISDIETIDVLLEDIIKSFRLTTYDNNGLPADVEATVIGNNVYVGIPDAPVVSNNTVFVPTIEHNGLSHNLPASLDFSIQNSFSVVGKNGNDFTYNIIPFTTFKENKIPEIIDGTNYFTTKLIDGNLYMAYSVKGSTVPSIRSYDIETGVLGDNFANIPDHGSQIKIFNISGTSINDLVLTFLNGTHDLYIYKYDGSSWTLLTSKYIGDFVSISNYNGSIYIGTSLISEIDGYQIYKFNPKYDNQLNQFKVLQYARIYQSYVLNSLYVENESSIYVNLNDGSSTQSLTSNYYNGSTWTELIGTGVQNIYNTQTAINTANTVGGAVLVDYLGPVSGEYYTAQISNSGGITNLGAMSTALPRSFYDGNVLKRVLTGSSRVRLQKYNPATPDWEVEPWTITGTTFMYYTQVDYNNKDLFVVYSDGLSSTGLYFVHINR